jgi:dihydroorotate dehydrogenase electron transfer subunit
MVRRQTAVLRYARPAPPLWEVRLDLNVAPAAGAYLLADFGGPVREPLYPVEIDGVGFVTSVVPGHPATRLLPGTGVDVLGPLGRGFRLHTPGYALARLLLIADVAFLPLLRPLYQAAPAVALIVEATTRAQIPSPSQFPASLELTLVTRDGSSGYLGPIEAEGNAPVGLERAGGRVRELLLWAERVCFACDPERYPALATLVQQVRLQPQPDFAQALIQSPMPCGVGVCDVCRVILPRGDLHACVDGPVLDLLSFLAL